MQFFRGNVEARIERRTIQIPKITRGFHIPPGDYVIVNAEVNVYKYLDIYPRVEWEKVLLHHKHIDENLADELVARSSDLEVKVISNGRTSFSLPKSSVQYLGLPHTRYTKLRVLGNINHVEIWKPEDFDGINAPENRIDARKQFRSLIEDQPTL